MNVPFGISLTDIAGLIFCGIPEEHFFKVFVADAPGDDFASSSAHLLVQVADDAVSGGSEIKPIDNISLINYESSRDFFQERTCVSEKLELRARVENDGPKPKG